MSRFVLVGSLVAALTASAFARDGAVQFARPPEATPASAPVSAEPVEPASMRMPAPDIDGPHVLDRATVRAKLLANRKANLARFRAYQQKGVYPNNTYRDGKLNVWIDAFGNLCAAATIISASGLHDLVLEVGSENNFIRLKDVRQGPLMDWMLTSGLTQEEIVAIQEPGFRVGGPVAEPAPEPIIAIDSKLRQAEDARLTAHYK